jgi:Fur family transcriptional regulator, stress-responsive regulator
MTSSANLLRDSHLRVTAARVAVLEVLAERSHLTTDDIAAGVRERIGSVSTQASYHVLDALTAAGLLRRIEVAGSAARYERRVGDNHHHLVCRSCGEVSDIDCRTTTPAGYKIDEAEIVFWGTCPRCQTASAILPIPRSIT